MSKQNATAAQVGGVLMKGQRSLKRIKPNDVRPKYMTMGSWRGNLKEGGKRRGVR
jgi:hypothetical protein